MCCKNCKDRRLGCHGKCEKYNAYRVEKEREKDARRRDIYFPIYLSQSRTVKI